MISDHTRHGAVLVVCAPSGAGKTTLIARLRKEFPSISYSVSCTTRAPRPGEVDGRDYHFLTEEDFLHRRNANEFAETARVHANLYGTPLAPVEAMRRAGQDVLFDIDVQGAAQLRLTLPRARFVFVFPPSMAELERRLRTRATDDETAVRRRLANAVAEMEQAHWFDAWVVNDTLDAAYDVFRAWYLTATLDPSLRPRMPFDMAAESR